MIQINTSKYALNWNVNNAKVSKEQQRDFIGFEINPKYCKISDTRKSQEGLINYMEERHSSHLVGILPKIL